MKINSNKALLTSYTYQKQHLIEVVTQQFLNGIAWTPGSQGRQYMGKENVSLEKSSGFCVPANSLSRLIAKNITFSHDTTWLFYVTFLFWFSFLSSSFLDATTNLYKRSGPSIHSPPVCVEPFRRTDRGTDQSPTVRFLLAPLYSSSPPIPISIGRSVAALLNQLTNWATMKSLLSW